MFDSFETDRATVGRFTVRVVSDPDGGFNPRENDNLGTIWTAHRNYNSPDSYRGEFWDALAREFDVRAVQRWRHNGQFVPRDCCDYETDSKRILAAINRDSVWVWVFMYEHSGVIYRAAADNPFSCRWDSGRVGVAFVKRDKLAAEYGPRLTKAIRAKALACLVAEVDEYSDWASGNVWGFVVEDEDGNQTGESCWGFIGDEGARDALSEGMAEAEALEREALERDAAKREAKAEKMARKIAESRPDLAPIWQGGAE